MFPCLCSSHLRKPFQWKFLSERDPLGGVKKYNRPGINQANKYYFFLKIVSEPLILITKKFTEFRLKLRNWELHEAKFAGLYFDIFPVTCWWTLRIQKPASRPRAPQHLMVFVQMLGISPGACLSNRIWAPTEWFSFEARCFWAGIAAPIVLLVAVVRNLLPDPHAPIWAPSPLPSPLPIPGSCHYLIQ